MVKALVFPGQGAQIVGMGKDFFDNFAVARDVFNEVDNSLNKKLSQIIFDGPQETLTQTVNAQPAIMCVSIAILKVIEKETGKSISDLCNFTAGHSLGEYTSLCASESISLENTTKLLKIRGEQFTKASEKNPGSMCALLGGTIQLVTDLISKVKESESQDLVIQIANDNTVGQVVLSGHEKLIDKALLLAKDVGFKKATKLSVSGAFHSVLMQPAVGEMENILNTILIKQPKVKFLPNVTANIIEDIDDIKLNLIKQITAGVRWRETMESLQKNGVTDIVEIGPSKILSPLVGRTLENTNATTINNLETLKLYLDS
jgi:[acyl-carrier-protein] S-malonyltransferase